MAGFLKKLFGGTEGQSAGNPFQGMDEKSRQALEGFYGRDAQQSSREYEADPVLGALHRQYASQIGKVGGLTDEASADLAKSRAEEADLSARGYSLKPEDYEAYGQAAGDITRQFGKAEGSLAQALANRGMTQSGSANRAFMTSAGNKMEQLAGMQRKIADDRMKTNMQRLGKTRDFMNSLYSQRSGLLRQQSGLMGQQGSQALSGIGMKDQNALNKAQLAQGTLGASAQQGNQAFEQKAATGSSGLMGALRRGSLAGVESGTKMLAGGAMEKGAENASSGMGALMSDSNLKQSISSGDQEIQRLMDAISPKEFEYKDPNYGAGKLVGVMAQDIQKSPMGEEAVVETQDGLGIDQNKGLSTALAGIANLNKRLKSLGA